MSLMAAASSRWAPVQWPTGIRRVAAYAVQPLAVGIVGFGFAYATGGVEAVRFWLLAIPVSAWEILRKTMFLVAAFIGTGGLIQLIWVPYLVVDRVSNWAWRGRYELDGLSLNLGVTFWVLLRFLESLVAVAAEHSALAPAHIPYAASGWGTVGAGVLGLVSLALASVGGARVRLALNPPRHAPGLAGWSDLDESPMPEEFWSSEVVVAWRAWKWNGKVLKGVWRDWTSTRLEAECGSCPEPPGWNHSCGIYAFKDPSALNSHLVHHEGLYVFGRVELSGLVTEHETGYRAARAEILELVAPREAVPAIERRYPSVPVSVQRII